MHLCRNVLIAEGTYSKKQRKKTVTCKNIKTIEILIHVTSKKNSH